MSKKSPKIVDGKGEKNIGGDNLKIPAIISIIVIILIASGVGVYLHYDKKQAPNDYKDYEKKAQIYVDEGIDYSYEDYKKDEKVIQSNKDKDIEVKETETPAKDNVSSEKEVKETQPPSSDIGSSGTKDKNLTDNSSTKPNKDIVVNDANKGGSNPSKELQKTNDSLLEDLKKDTGIDITTTGVGQSIAEQTVAMNEWINSHLGYPDDSFNDDYKGVKMYIDSVISSFTGGKAFDSPYSMSLEEVQAEVRFCIAENLQYRTGNGFTQYNAILKNWMDMGHPSITSIDSINITKIKKPELVDNMYLPTLLATVVSNGTHYEITLTTSVVDNGPSLYKILDIKKI